MCRRWSRRLRRARRRPPRTRGCAPAGGRPPGLRVAARCRASVRSSGRARAARGSDRRGPAPASEIDNTSATEPQQVGPITRVAVALEGGKPRATMRRSMPTLVAHPRPVRRQSTRWWQRPRVRSALIIVVLALVTVAARAGAHLETDWLWFHELAQERVFCRLLTMRWIAGSAAGIATASVLLLNLWIMARGAPSDAGLPEGDPRARQLRRVVRWTCAAVAVGAGVVIGRSVAIGNWELLALWLHRQPFHARDPLFHRDIGFFVFSLPLYQKLVQWLLLTAGVALAAAVLGHVATGAIRMKPPPVSPTRAAHRHVLALAAVLLLGLAGSHWLGQYSLELARSNRTVPGAGYTEVHVLLPWLRVLVVVALACAAMMAVAAVRRSWALPAVAIAIVAVAELVNPAVLPSVVQRLVVDPQ